MVPCAKITWLFVTVVPVVCDGCLYLRHGEFLYAYDVKERK